MKTNEIVDKIRNDYKKINTLAINYEEGQDFIEIIGMKYEGKEENFATSNQINFLLSFNNVSGYETSLKYANKWFASACIEIAKNYPDQKFDISL